MTEEEWQEEDSVQRVKFSEDGSLLAVRRVGNLEMWKTSTWERMWSVSCNAYDIDFSPDGLRVLANQVYAIHAYDVRSGDTLGEIDSMPESIHDHVHMFWGEIGEIWKCNWCKSSPLKNGEYWFTGRGRCLWVVEERMATRLIYIPVEYGSINDIKVYSGYVAIGHWSGWLVLDTGRNSEVV